MAAARCSTFARPLEGSPSAETPLGLARNHRQPPLACFDQVRQLSEHVRVDALGVGQDAVASLGEIPLHERHVVQISQRGEIADAIRQLEDFGSRASVPHDAQQVLGLRLPHAVREANRHLHHQLVNSPAVVVDAGNLRLGDPRHRGGILEEIVNHGCLEQHGIRRLVVEQDCERADLMAEHVAAGPARRR